MNGKCELDQGETNPCYEDEEGYRDQDEAVVPAAP